MKPTLIKDKTIKKYGHTLYRLYWPKQDREGGWSTDKVCWPDDTTADAYGDACFFGGEIWGGEIWGGVILGGVIKGGKHTQSPAMAQRSDGWCFIAHPVESELRIWAGCRDFSWDEAVAHWDNPQHSKRAESMRIINFLREQVEAREKGNSHE